MYRIVGGLLIIFAIADFGSSYAGYNLTPFLPPGLARFSPIIIGLLGGFLLKMGEKEEQSNEDLGRFVTEAKKRATKK